MNCFSFAARYLQIKKVVGIIPINDYSFEELWYVMEYANPIMPELKKSKFSLNEIIKGS